MEVAPSVSEFAKRIDSKVLAALRIQSKALWVVHKFFREKGFVELLPVVLSTTTDPLGPDPGSSVIKTPEIEYLGQRFVLTQSMILHKQIAIGAGIDRLYTVSPNIRLEKPERAKSGKHLFEFSQVDFEVAHARMGDIMGLVEELFVEIIKTIRRGHKAELELWGRKLRIPRRPFKVFTTHELEEKYGKDWEKPASLEAKEPFWVICHKREFYDKEDPERPGHFLNYDLIYPEGFGEALSGAEREWEYQRILERIKRDGLPLERYRPFLELAKRGFLRPSAGAGFGVERLTRFLVGAKHVGDTQLFPRIPGKRVVV